MSGKRRTRKEKLKASLRREVQISSTMENVSTPTYSFTHKTATELPTVKVSAILHQSFAYVTKDAKKTLVITSAIAVINIFIFMLVKHRVINLGIFGL